jgi:uncharacterized UPF0160 family protein
MILILARVRKSPPFKIQRKPTKFIWMSKTIAVHNQNFHADDCLSVYFLHNTKEFENANVVRSRDPAILAHCDAVCDTGGVYDHEKRRYDHHQPSFNETFPGSDIPLASCGTVYFHFGREIVTNILAENGRDIGEHVEYVYQAMYHGFLKEVDASDNGVSQYPTDVEPLYMVHTGISQRIVALNIEGSFDQAVALIGNEFKEKLLLVFDSEIPEIDVVKGAFEARFEIDESGLIVVLADNCGFDKHLRRLETESQCNPILFVVYPQTKDNWAVKAISTGRGFERRKKLPFAGFCEPELSQASGVPDGVVVDRAGTLAVFRTREAAVAFAKLAVAA